MIYFKTNAVKVCLLIILI